MFSSNTECDTERQREKGGREERGGKGRGETEREREGRGGTEQLENADNVLLKPW